METQIPRAEASWEACCQQCRLWLGILGTCRKDKDINCGNLVQVKEINLRRVPFPHLQNEKLGLISKSLLALKNTVIL